ncbi:hypothetical protein LTR37_010700 [Vermiconidia calcicola]|uniref:Uncharacterized protein n=1 Tax=Vermiconidia calcicola TaxID=1690605 RepID=A0ACC3N4M6_9PEZI|nr:hypothetical protein LTR37_010700 [Vermiconidia calcicola]
MALPPIAILGAGPSGLTLARLLYLSDISYIIFEREETAHARDYQGGALDLHVATGQAVLREAGLFDRFRDLSRWDAATMIANKEGRVLVNLAPEGDEDARPEIDRKELRRLLLDSIPAESVRWASRVKEVTKEADCTMSVRLENGKVEAGFRLVVGADGAWSKARSLVTSATPKYSGMHYLTSRIPTTSPHYRDVKALIGNGNYLALGSGKGIVAQRMGDGSYTANACLHLPEHWKTETNYMANPSKLRTWLLHDCFADWAKVNTDLIKHSEGGFRTWILYGLSEGDVHWEHVPGVTLVGDAAHVTPPSGEGVNAAMYDSLSLAQLIVQHGIGNLDLAVTEYEKALFPRAVDHIKAGKMDELLFGDDAPYVWLRTVGIDVDRQEKRSGVEKVKMSEVELLGS